jgi:hypothetical protein
MHHFPSGSNLFTNSLFGEMLKIWRDKPYEREHVKDKRKWKNLYRYRTMRKTEEKQSYRNVGSAGFSNIP